MAFRGVWLALAFAAPWSSAFAACAAVDGWQDGRAGKGRADGCDGTDYAEAHRLGASLHALQVEHRAIARAIAEKTVTDVGVQQRRQRQLDNDIEALRGLATIKGWPLEPAAAGDTP